MEIEGEKNKPSSRFLEVVTVSKLLFQANDCLWGMMTDDVVMLFSPSFNSQYTNIT